MGICYWCGKFYIGNKGLIKYGKCIPLCLSCRIKDKRETNNRKKILNKKCLKNNTIL